MMAEVLQTQLLIRSHRFKEAENLLRQALSADPQNARAHALLALALSGQRKNKEAVLEARHAVGLKPDSSYYHYVLAVTLLNSDQPDKALNAIREAIRLDPEDADQYRLLGKVHYQKSEWQLALNAAEEGLKFDPENIECTNLRAMCLVMLGRRDEAGLTIDTLLARDPENAQTHAVQGWALLHAHKYEQAMEHFREALRLTPNMEWARAGIVEALKARNPIYRLPLAYFLRMSRLTFRQQWAVILIGYAVIRTARRLMDSTELEPVFWLIVGLYGGFIVLAWTARPLFNLMLRLNRFGRLALSREQIVASNWIGSCILAGLILLGVGLALSGDTRKALLIAAVQSLALIIPVAGVFEANGRLARLFLILYTAGLAVVIAVGVGLSLVAKSANGVLFVVFFLGLVVYTWIANVLIMISRK